MTKLIQFQQGEKVWLTGNVVAIREGTGDGEGRVINVKLEGTQWNKDKKKEETRKIDVAFWNTDKEGGAQMRDRVLKAKVREGSFLAIVGFLKEDGKTAHGLDFMYRGRYLINRESEGKKNLNLFVGTVAQLYDNGNRANISLPTDEWNKETQERETVWNSITFWNNEEGQQLADNAKKILTPRETGKAQAVILASEAKPYIDKNGEERESFNGYRFDVIPRAKEKAPETIAEMEYDQEEEEVFEIPEYEDDMFV